MPLNYVQHDNYPNHTVKIFNNNKIEVRMWSAQSPDLNLNIENL